MAPARSTAPTSPAVAVRCGRPGDAASLAALGARTFRDTYAADVRPEDLETFVAACFRREFVAEGLRDADRRYLLAEVGGAPVGYALLRKEAPENTEWSSGGPTGAQQLAYLYVDRPFQGAGVGTALMRESLRQTRRGGADMIVLARRP